jgi:hypothetical protein
MNPSEESDVVYYDDVAYSPKDSGFRSRTRTAVPMYRSLPLPPDWAARRRRRRVEPVSRIDCLKAALRNFL